METTPGTTIDVPVTVTGFQNVSDISIDIVINSEVVSYVGVRNVHSALTGSVLSNFIPESQTIRFLFSANDFENGINIPDNAKLFDLRLDFCTDELSCAQNGSASGVVFRESETLVFLGFNYGFANLNLTFSNGSVYADPPYRILELEMVGNGVVHVNGNPYDGIMVFEDASSIQLTALPDEGWEFDSWSGDLNSTDNPVNLVLDAHKSIVATFTIKTYTINATAGPNGGISPSGDVVVNHGSSQGFTITPNAGYHIADVLVNGSSVGTSGSYTFENVTQSHTIHASFAINQYTIDVSVSPAVGGTVEGGGTYEHNESVTLTASPSAGYEFVNWTEDGAEVSTSVEYVFNAASSRTLVANFEEIPPQMYTLTVTIVGGGDVTVDGAAYTLPVDVEEGTTLNLAAIAGTGYEFVGWSGDVVSNSHAESILMDDDKNITATFTESNTSVETINYGINNLTFKIFPNPTKAIFSFQTEGCHGEGEIRVDILDLTGKIVLSKRLEAGKTVHSFSLERQHPGIYLIRVICGGQVSTKRLIKH